MDGSDGRRWRGGMGVFRMVGIVVGMNAGIGRRLQWEGMGWRITIKQRGT